MAGSGLTIGRVVDEETVARMHDAAVAILARTGITIEHEEALSETLRHDGFTLRDGRVCISAARTQDLTERLRSRNAEAFKVQ